MHGLEASIPTLEGTLHEAELLPIMFASIAQVLRNNVRPVVDVQ